MSTDEKQTVEETTEATPPAETAVALTYEGASQVISEEGASTVALFGNIRRDAVQAHGAVKDPMQLREALSALYAVVSSDFRYQPKDRTQYMAYLRLKKSAATQSVWQAQQAYFQWIARNDPTAFILLDPTVTVHPDSVLFEVFSRDEGTYACLGVRAEGFEFDGERRFGTTNIDFSDALFEGVQRMRSYRATRLSIGRQAVKLATTDAAGAAAAEVMEKQITVPDAWLRGFLQVQSSAALPADHFELAPLDLYNALRHLRLRSDPKRQRRGLRVELVPGEAPRLVLEPWETVIHTHGAAWKGKQAKVVRIWGRRRLMLVRRLLPFVSRIDVHVLGSGLPSFWIFRGEHFELTLGLSGFTSSNWSQALTFDLLLPRRVDSTEDMEKVITFLADRWVATASEIGKGTSLSGAALTAALQLGCQHGRLMFDLARGVYRLRPVTDGPVELSRIQFRNTRERVAHDLLNRKGAVKIDTENRIYGTGLELTGKVVVTEDKRDYRPQVLLDEEGQPRKVECTCSFFRKNALRQGPCEHVIALMLLYRQQEAERLANPGKARKTVTVETRTYSRREEGGEQIVQLTLVRDRVKVRWGSRGAQLRLQNMLFNSVDEARDAYFTRVDDLEKKGYLDATTG